MMTSSKSMEPDSSSLSDSDIIVYGHHQNEGLCHLKIGAKVPLSTEDIYKILVHPDNYKIFHNIKNSKFRKVLKNDGHGNLKVELEQTGIWRFLFLHGSFSCRLVINQSLRRKEIRYQLKTQGFLKTFYGSWLIVPYDQGSQMTKRLMEEFRIKHNLTDSKKGIVSDISESQNCYSGNNFSVQVNGKHKGTKKAKEFKSDSSSSSHTLDDVDHKNINSSRWNLASAFKKLLPKLNHTGKHIMKNDHDNRQLPNFVRAAPFEAFGFENLLSSWLNRRDHCSHSLVILEHNLRPKVLPPPPLHKYVMRVAIKTGYEVMRDLHREACKIARGEQCTLGEL